MTPNPILTPHTLCYEDSVRLSVPMRLSKGGLSASVNALYGRGRAPAAFLFSLPFVCSFFHSYLHNQSSFRLNYYRRLGALEHLGGYKERRNPHAVYNIPSEPSIKEYQQVHCPTGSTRTDTLNNRITQFDAIGNPCMQLPLTSLTPPGGLTATSDCKVLKRFYSTEGSRSNDGNQPHLVKKICVKMEAQSDMQQDSQPIETSTPTRNSHRTQREIELALEVINDQLADALPLDKPALELTAQSLTQKLLEMKKEEQPDAGISMERRQTTREYSQSLPAVLVGDGTQKYVLLRIPKQDDMVSDVYLVRGDPKAEYHYQTAIETIKDLESRDIMVGKLTCE